MNEPTNRQALDEAASLELITRMIRNTHQRMERGAGRPFLYFGYATVITSVLVWAALRWTHNPQWNWLWLLILVALPLTLLSARKDEVYVRTYIDRVVNSVWAVCGAAGFAVSLIASAGQVYTYPILSIITLIMGMGTVLTGLVIRFRPVTVAGIIGMALSFLFLFVTGLWTALLFGGVFLVMMIIPGHILNHAAHRAR